MNEKILRAAMEEMEKIWADIFRDTLLLGRIDYAVIILIECLRKGGTIFTAGNGGSAAQAEHFRAELVGRFREKGRRPLAAIALGSGMATLTALANDFGYSRVFADEISACGRKGDVFLGFSTSGNSLNIVNAIETALLKNMEVVCLFGADDGLLQEHVFSLRRSINCIINVPSRNTQRVQETHLILIHYFCEIIDAVFAKE